MRQVVPVLTFLNSFYQIRRLHLQACESTAQRVLVCETELRTLGAIALSCSADSCKRPGSIFTAFDSVISPERGLTLARAALCTSYPPARRG